ncbi:MAG: hypothetical protein ACREMC_05210 [Gemmatimonadales bacterium]
MRAEDPDGIDSVWVTVDAVVVAQDGLLERVFTSRFRFPIAAGKTDGTQIPVEIRARDVAGFQVTQDTHVVVVP